MKNLNKILLVVALLIVGVAIALTFNKDDAPDTNEEIVEGGQEPGGIDEQTPGRNPDLTPPSQDEGPGTLTPDEVIPKVTPTPTPKVTPPVIPPTAIRLDGPLKTEEELRDHIFGADPQLRDTALNEMTRLLERSQGKNLLDELIKSQNPENEEEVTALLPHLPEEERLPFIDTMLDSPNPEFREDSLSQLRDIVGYDVNDLLIKGMKDTDENVLEEAGDLLIYFDDHEIYQAAWEGLTHPVEEIRENAFGYFEDSHTGESVRYLIEMFRVPNPDGYPEYTAENIGDALRFITDADQIETNGYDEWRTWSDEFLDEWIAENDPPDEDLTPQPAIVTPPADPPTGN